MIVADTGGLLALANEQDKHHAKVHAFFERCRTPWILPAVILCEVDYLLRKEKMSNSVLMLIDDIRAGAFTLDARMEDDLPRIRELLEKYDNLDLGLTDAAVMALAERLRAKAIVTVDERDFRTVELDIRPKPRLVPLDPE